MDKWDKRDRKVSGRRKTAKSKSYRDRVQNKRTPKRLDKETRAGLHLEESDA